MPMWWVWVSHNGVLLCTFLVLQKTTGTKMAVYVGKTTSHG
jgi:hypothetical protein